MNELSPGELSPVVTISHQQAVTTSLALADTFGKQHKDVIRKIEEITPDLESDFIERNFTLNEYTDSIGRKLPMYEITRDGFMLLAMGFTGKHALKFKVAYIAAFNAMEQQLLQSHPPFPFKPLPALPPPPALALPPPDLLPKEICAAINRKAHALSLTGFDQLREKMTARATEHKGWKFGEADLLQEIERYGTEREEMIWLPTQILSDLVFSLVTMRIGIDQAEKTVQRLTEQTGRIWPTGKRRKKSPGR